VLQVLDLMPGLRAAPAAGTWGRFAGADQLRAQLCLACWAPQQRALKILAAGGGIAANLKLSRCTGLGSRTSRESKAP
jgi:hypothetical protein